MFSWICDEDAVNICKSYFWKFVPDEAVMTDIVVLWCIMWCFPSVQEEGRPLWADGSAHNLTDNAISLLPANQTDCFALQRNATGPGYFLTPFFCHIALPFICQYQSKFLLLSIINQCAHSKIWCVTICPNPNCHYFQPLFLKTAERNVLKFFFVMFSTLSQPLLSLPPSPLTWFR